MALVNRARDKGAPGNRAPRPPHLRPPGLRPVETAFHDLLAESAGHLVVGAGLLAEMLADTADQAEVAARMRAAEHEADETTHALVKRTTISFVTPFDRADLHALASAFDDVMDAMDAAVDKIWLYRPKVLPPEFSEQVEVLRQCADVTLAAMPGLRDVGSMGEVCIELNRLENTGSRLHRRIVAGLLGGQYKALEAMKLKDIAETLAGAVTGFERIAGVVELIIVKES